MTIDSLKRDLQILARAQDLLIECEWLRVESIQKPEKSNSTAYGTVYIKDNKTVYLNLITAPNILKMLQSID
jgi:predicted DNA-binding ArsR family transcriptional regulator